MVLPSHLSLLCAFCFLRAASAAPTPETSTSSQPACSRCTPMIDPKNPGHYVHEMEWPFTPITMPTGKYAITIYH